MMVGEQHWHGASRRLTAVDTADAPSRSPRRPRRDDLVTYRVRIDLEGTDPPLWRRLELASDLFLDQLHDIIQVAFGWTDSHLHRFDSGPDRFGARTEHYLCPFDVDEGDTGIPEGRVRLDEVLAEPGDRLWYCYDYGDNWQHVIVLEAVLQPMAQGSGLAVCTDGFRRGPAEDCGGTHIYQLVEAANDPGNARAAGAIAELYEIFGSDIDIDAMVGRDYSADEINGALDLGWGTAKHPAASGRPRPLDLSMLPPPLADLLDAVRTSPERRMLRCMIDFADLTAPVLVDEAVAAAMVRPYAWLLDRVGDAGIKLTTAGYLPPADVKAAVSELGLGEEWIGKGNRESQTLPVLDLRETAQRAGLLRKYSGRLKLTPRGRTARADPAALWWRLAESMPPARDECERQAGLLLLLILVAGAAADWAEITAGVLTAIGWRTGFGEPLTSSAAFHAAWSTHSVLRRIGAFESEAGSYRRGEPSREGVSFARAALLTWPTVRSRR
jgi:Plasmid pRiA4b ORF-3-like protein